MGFGKTIAEMGALGAGAYGFFNRLLIPTGLHHALNSVFWFDVAGINDIPNFLGGARSIGAGVWIPGVTGMYQAGFFPIMMFGLVGAGLAFVHTSRPENRARTASIMLAAGFATFLTGVTEPVEFAFLFLAPWLFLIHALLTGISLYLAASMQWIAGFGFSAGLDNLLSIDACVTRLRLEVRDGAQVDDAALKVLGARGVIRQSANTAQVVFGARAETIGFRPSCWIMSAGAEN